MSDFNKVFEFTVTPKGKAPYQMFYKATSLKLAVEFCIDMGALVHCGTYPSDHMEKMVTS